MKAPDQTDELKRDLASLPNAPGVYFFKDASGKTLYIGKAASLRSRVRSYWNTASWHERPKLAVMMPKIVRVETIVTNSEKEALLLEANLVRKHMPQYNVHLKDDKRYPWLAITYDEAFPRLIMVRDPVKFRQQNPKSKVFGPYVETGAMWNTVRILRKVFPMRQRRKPLFKDRPCMNFYIGLCLGPCQNLVQEESYNQMVSQAEMFLAGNQTEVVRQLRKQMEDAAERLDFEQAAKLRNRIFALEKVIEKQQVFFQNQQISQDIVAEAHTERAICISLLRIREGKLISSETVTLPLLEKTRWDEAFGSFLDQYYTTCEDVSLPRELLLQHEIEDAEALAQVMSAAARRQVKITVPQKGSKRDLIDMAEKNARTTLDRESSDQSAEDQKVAATLASLKEDLGLTRLPRRIECFDISNIQGSDNVASMVVFENARAKKSDYRRFKVRSVEGGANDFASMKEVVGRRYRRLIEQGLPLPDLIIIDGGRGQLNAALEALAEIRSGGIAADIIGLAKKQEEVYLPGKPEPLALPRRSEALHLLQRARDEAHRFAITFHRKLRAKRSLSSGLDGLPGVGPARRKLLLAHFGSFDRLKAASLQELESVPGLPKAVADKVHRALASDDSADEGNSGSGTDSGAPEDTDAAAP